MNHRFLLLGAACAVLSGCSSTPPAYPPPPQRQFVHAPFVSMAEPEAGAYIKDGVRGFTEGGGWRWTYDHPEFQFPLDRSDGWRFRMDFSLPAPNLKQTGPLTVALFINGNLLQKVRYTAPGNYSVEEPVPAAWLAGGREARVSAEIAPPWISPGGVERLGVVLLRVGFVR